MKRSEKAILVLVALCILVPCVSVLVCRRLRLAQGELSEELVFGVMVGIALDFLLCLAFVITRAVRESRKR